jgi:hypothetical protein
MLVIVPPLTSEWIEAFFNGQDIEAVISFEFFHNSCSNITIALEEFLVNVMKI